MNSTDRITQHSLDRPYAVAIIEGDRLMHYCTLEASIWSMAADLHNRGIRPGDIVGMSLRQSTRYLVAVLALARMGATQTALPLGEPQALRASTARKFGVKWIIADSEAEGVTGIATIQLPLDALDAPSADISPDLRCDAADLPWTINRTSGTTGEVKGVARTHRDALANHAQLMSHCPTYLPSANDCVLAAINMSFTYGLGINMLTLMAGATLVIPTQALTPASMLALIDRYAISRLSVTPMHLQALLPQVTGPGVRCPSLVELSVSSMEMPESLRSEVRRKISPTLSIKYGAIETSAITAADAALQARYPETVGKPLPFVEVEIVDADGTPVPPAEPGRVRIRSPLNAAGYIGDEGTNQVKFSGGWFYPGDVGFLSAEGLLFLRGREDDMMNFNGIKIMPADIEEVLLAHEAVVEAAAFPGRSVRHQDVPMAAVTLRETVDPKALLAYCQQRLGIRAPKFIGILATLPKNPMGKVLKRELAARFTDSLARQSKAAQSQPPAPG